jgi:hypothetical protein
MLRRTAFALRRRAARLSFGYREFMWRNHWIRQLLSVARWQPIRIGVVATALMCVLPGLLSAAGTALYAGGGAPATATVESCREVPIGRGGDTIECSGSWVFADGTTGNGRIHNLARRDSTEGGEVGVRADEDSAYANPFDPFLVVVGLLTVAAIVAFVRWSAPRRRRPTGTTEPS